MKLLTEFLGNSSAPPVIPGSPSSRWWNPPPVPRSHPGHFQSSKKAPSCDVNQTQKVDKSLMADILRECESLGDGDLRDASYQHLNLYILGENNELEGGILWEL